MIVLFERYMESLITYLGSFYVVVGAIFLFVPITYLELGRPKDLIKAFLNLLIGLFLIIKNKTIDEPFFVILLFLSLLILFYIVEIFLSRWYQLTDSEKKKLTTFMEFKNNLLKILEAIKLGIKNSAEILDVFNFDKDKNINSKKWVRNNKNDNIKA